MKGFYTGVGSRETPLEVLSFMENLATKLEVEGYVLRSGGAGGADSAFEAGCVQGKKVIYTPWWGFNGHSKNNRKEGYVVFTDIEQIVQDARESRAKDLHPAWDRCSNGAKLLHSRNILQVLGHQQQKLKSNFLVCWARVNKEGEASGGTATAIRLAEEEGVKVCNLFLPEVWDKLNKYMED